MVQQKQTQFLHFTNIIRIYNIYIYTYKLFKLHLLNILNIARKYVPKCIKCSKWANDLFRYIKDNLITRFTSILD